MSDKWGLNEWGPTPLVKLCRFGGSGFGFGKERLEETSTEEACEGEWLGELDVVSEGEVVFGDVVVVEDEDEAVSLATLVLSFTCLALSVTLFLLFVDWQVAETSVDIDGDASSGVGGANLLWVGWELKKGKKNVR